MYKTMRLFVFFFSLLCAASVFAQSPDPIWLFDDMDSNGRWAKLSVTGDCTEGTAALKLTAAQQGAVMAGRDNTGLQIDWYEWALLVFDYKIAGSNVTAVGCKVRYYPFHDGQQVVYFVPESALTPGVWHTAMLDLRSPSAIWSEGTKPENREFSLRMHTSSNDTAYVIYDNIRLVRDVFVLEQPAPTVSRTPVGGYDFTHHLILKNTGASPLTVAISMDVPASSPLTCSSREHRIALQARSEETIDIPVHLDATHASDVQPLTRFTLYGRLEIAEIPELNRSLTLSAATPLDLPSHPRLLLTRDMLPEILAKAQTYDWAKARYDRILREADKWVGQVIQIPNRGGQWPQYYVCNEHNVTLRTLSDTQHQCPVDGKIYTGEPYDSVIILRKHNDLVAAARNLGLAYQFTGERKYAAKCAEILLGYADKYLTYPLIDHQGNPSSAATRASWNSLGESNWAIPLIEGYDCIYESGVLTPGQIERINRDVWQVCAADIAKHDTAVHNFSCWHMGAIGSIGLCIGSAEWIDFAINGPRGMRRQYAEGILDDGMWFEGSWGYHFYALTPTLHLSEACAHVGIDLYTPRLKTMFEAPVQMAMPDLSLPAFNDSGTGGSIRSRANYWEKAYSRYGDAIFGGMLRYSNRETDDALLYGLPNPPINTLTPGSKNFTGSGIAVLRGKIPAGEQYIALDYGPHGSGHGHPDKLGFVWYGLDRILALDPGSVNYSLTVHDAWYRQTLSHNTIVVDQRSQGQTEGTCLGFRGNGDAPFASAESDGAYPGVTLRRTVILTRSGPLLVDWALSEAEHTYDWAYHNYGSFSSSVSFNPTGAFYGLTEGYDRIEDPRESEPLRSFRGTWLLDGGPERVDLSLVAQQPVTMFTGMGYGYNAAEKLPMVIARQRGKQAVWVALLVPGKSNLQATSFALEQAALELTRVRVASPDGEWLYEIALINGKVDVVARDMSTVQPGGSSRLDFDGDGLIGFSDFIQFALCYGATEGDDVYDVRFDLDDDKQIGFGDFLQFARDFGKAVSTT